MIIETKTTSPFARQIAFDDQGIVSIAESNDGKASRVTMYGDNEVYEVIIPYADMLKIFQDVKKRSGYFDKEPPEKEFTQGTLVEVGIYKFSLDTYRSKHEDGWAQQIWFNANFPVAEPMIHAVIQNIAGVEKEYSKYSGKYTCNINIGRLFDLEDVKWNLERAIKMFLEQ